MTNGPGPHFPYKKMRILSASWRLSTEPPLQGCLQEGVSIKGATWWSLNKSLDRIIKYRGCGERQHLTGLLRLREQIHPDTTTCTHPPHHAKIHCFRGPTQFCLVIGVSWERQLGSGNTCFSQGFPCESNN